MEIAGLIGRTIAISLGLLSLTAFASPIYLMPGGPVSGVPSVHDKFTGRKLELPLGWTIEAFDDGIFSKLTGNYRIRYSVEESIIDVALSHSSTAAKKPFKKCDAGKNLKINCSGQSGNMKIRVTASFSEEGSKAQGQSIIDKLPYWEKDNNLFDRSFWVMDLPLPKPIKSMALIDKGPLGHEQTIFNVSSNYDPCIVEVQTQILEAKAPHPKLEALETETTRGISFLKKFRGQRVVVSVNRFRNSNPSCEVAYFKYIEKIKTWAKR